MRPTHRRDSRAIAVDSGSFPWARRPRYGGDSRSISVDSLERRTLLSGVIVPAYPEIIGEPIVIGTRQLIDITFTATSGRKTTISVHDAQASVTFGGSVVPLLANKHGFFPNGTEVPVESILITDAVPGKASLTERSAYGVGTFSIGSITGGDIGSILLPDVNLTGGLSVSSVNRLTLNSTVGTTISLGKSAGVINITGNLTGSLTAGSIKSLTANALAGANVTTTAAFNRSALEMGSVTAKGGISQSNIISAGNIGTISTGFIQDSVISAAANLSAATAGTYPSALTPGDGSVFTASAQINSIRVIPGSTGGTFGDSVIAAHKIKSANIGQITGGGGIAAQSFGSFSAIGPSGELDSITMHLNSKTLHSASTLQAALRNLGVAFSQTPGLTDVTSFYDLELNVLS